jgi:hypothetical protein
LPPKPVPIQKQPGQEKIVCKMTLTEYAMYCCTGVLPLQLQAALDQPSFLKDILCALDFTGRLEPETAHRPGACDIRVIVDADIIVPEAVINDSGMIVPSEKKAITICAPLNRALMVDQLRVSPSNLTAARQPRTQPVYKRVNLGTFGENWCLSFEPAEQPNQFVNIEHILVPPKAGFSVFVQNFDLSSEAIYHVHAEMWASC